MRLISRPRQYMLSRIYAVESVVVPAGPATNVPLTMALSSIRQTTGDWFVEPRSLGIGILPARTLMRVEGRRSAVQVINMNQEDFVIGRGEFIGEAEQVAAADNEPGDRPRERMSTRKRRRFLRKDRSRNRIFPRTGMPIISKW